MKLRLGILIFSALTMTCTARTWAAVRYVNAAATGTGSGDSWQNAFTDVNTALSAAVAGDELWVVAAVYLPTQTGDAAVSFVLKPGVAMYGGFAGNETSRGQRDFAANVTRLSGDLNGDDLPNWGNMTDNSRHVVIANGVDASAILDGFWIIGGRANSFADPGAGMKNTNASPTIANCRFAFNFGSASPGAGMMNVGSSPTITNCEFVGNHCTIAGGAGMYNQAGSVPEITDCLFSFNSIQTTNVPGDGAAIFNDFNCPITIRGSTFANNFAWTDIPGNVTFGGAILNHAAGLLLLNCRFYGNSADIGGAIWNGGTNTQFINCTFVDHNALAGGAIANFNSTLTVMGCAIVGNNAGEGGGVSTTSNGQTLLTDSIFWGNTAPGQPAFNAQIHNGPTGATDILYSCVQGLLTPPPGEPPPDPADFPGSIEGDPLFVDANGPDNIPGTEDDDLRLSSGSPCIDAGDNLVLPTWLTTDLDGNPRLADDSGTADTGNGTAPIADMGPFEFASVAGGVVPAVSTWGITVMMLLLLSSGTIVLRCKRPDVR